MTKNMFPTYTNRHIFEQLDKLHAACFRQHFQQNMFPTLKKSGMGEHKWAKNMFPIHIIWHIFEQWE